MNYCTWKLFTARSYIDRTGIFLIFFLGGGGYIRYFHINSQSTKRNIMNSFGLEQINRYIGYFVVIYQNKIVYIESLPYSLNKKEWICSLFKEWILEKSEIRVNFEWTFDCVIHSFWSDHRDHSGIPSDPWGQNEWITQMFTPNSLQIHSNFTLF